MPTTRLGTYAKRKTRKKCALAGLSAPFGDVGASSAGRVPGLAMLAGSARVGGSYGFLSFSITVLRDLGVPSRSLFYQLEKEIMLED